MLFDEPTSALDPENDQRSVGCDASAGQRRYDHAGGYSRDGLREGASDQIIFMDAGQVVEHWRGVIFLQLRIIPG